MIATTLYPNLACRHIKYTFGTSLKICRGVKTLLQIIESESAYFYLKEQPPCGCDPGIPDWTVCKPSGTFRFFQMATGSHPISYKQ